MITFNLELGPWNQATRKGELDACMEHIYSTTRPEQNPVFMTLLGDIVADLESSRVALFPREQPLDHEVWEYLQHRTRNPVTGRRIAMNRFGAPYHAAMKCRPWWTTMLWERTALALNQDMLRGKLLVEKLAADMGKQDIVAAPHMVTTPARPQLQDKSLRACCANAVAVSVLTLQQLSHNGN